MIKLIMAIVIATTLVGCHSFVVKPAPSMPAGGAFGGAGGVLGYGGAGGGF